MEGNISMNMVNLKRILVAFFCVLFCGNMLGKELLSLDFTHPDKATAGLYEKIFTEREGKKCIQLDAQRSQFAVSLPSVESSGETTLTLELRASSTSEPQGIIKVMFQKYDSELKKYTATFFGKDMNPLKNETVLRSEIFIPKEESKVVNGRLLISLYKKRGLAYITNLNLTIPDAEKFLLRKTTVVISPEAGAKVRFASRELAYYIGEITGEKISLVTDGENVSGPKIHVGMQKGLHEPDFKKCAYDGYWLKTQPDGSLLIVGRSETGTEFGVYGFLQDFCGIRFYFPGREGTFVPKNPNLGIPEIDKLNNPFFRNRNFYSPSAYDKDWFRHNRAIDRYPCGHALSTIIRDEYAKTNPEYFAYSKKAGTRLLPGSNGRRGYQQQPCMTNPDVIRLCAEYVIDYFRKNPEEDCVSLGVNDNTAYCQCPECEKVNAGAGLNDVNMPSYGKLAVHFYNSVAGELVKVFPDKYIGVMGYNNTRTVPKGEKYHQNVVFRVAENEDMYFDPGSVNYSGIAEFRNGCSTLMLSGWRYGAGYLVPNFPLRLEEEYLDFCAAFQIFGISKEVFTFWRLNGIKDYIYMRKLWDPSLRAETMLEEFAENMYGGGAPEILKFYDLARRTWENQRVEYPQGEHVRGTTGQFRLYNAEICAQLLRHLENARKLAGKDIQGAVWLDRQIELFRWLGDFHRLAAVWRAPEPQNLTGLADWCIAFEKMRRDVDRKFQLIREPQVADQMDNWYPAVNNAFLLFKRCTEAGDRKEWKRFVAAVGDDPEIQWLDRYGEALLKAENLLKNPEFSKTPGPYSEMMMASGKITGWQIVDWMGSKKPGGRRIDTENGTLILEGIQGRRTMHPLPVATQEVTTVPGQCYVFMSEYRCVEAENISGVPWMSGYRRPPYTDTFKPYIIFYEAPKNGHKFLPALAMTGIGRTSYRKPVFAAVTLLPEAPAEPKLYFVNHVPPVLPEGTIFNLMGNEKRVIYSYEGLYDLKVRITASGGGTLKITASESAPNWNSWRTPVERGDIFSAPLEKEEKIYEFIYRPKENYTYSTTFRIQKIGGGLVKRVELIPVSRGK